MGNPVEWRAYWVGGLDLVSLVSCDMFVDSGSLDPANVPPVENSSEDIVGSRPASEVPECCISFVDFGGAAVDAPLWVVWVVPVDASAA